MRRGSLLGVFLKKLQQTKPALQLSLSSSSLSTLTFGTISLPGNRHDPSSFHSFVLAEDFRTASIRDFAENGFARYATQPASIAAFRVNSLSLAVMKMTGIEKPALAICRLRLIPDWPLRLISRMRQVASRRLARLKKSSMESNTTALKPCTLKRRSIALSMFGSSSTTMISFRDGDMSTFAAISGQAA